MNYLKTTAVAALFTVSPGLATEQPIIDFNTTGCLRDNHAATFFIASVMGKDASLATAPNAADISNKFISEVNKEALRFSRRIDFDSLNEAFRLKDTMFFQHFMEAVNQKADEILEPAIGSLDFQVTNATVSPEPMLACVDPNRKKYDI